MSNLSASDDHPHATPSPDPLETLKTRVAELESQLAQRDEQIKEQEKKFLYLYAEFENFKKRAIKERADTIKFGWESVARDLLTVLDNLERALAHVPGDTDKNLVAGLDMVAAEFRSSLKKQGAEIIPTLGQPFDPNLHEGVGQEESDQPEGTIIREHLRGYTLHGRLLRPARVVLSAGRGQKSQS